MFAKGILAACAMTAAVTLLPETAAAKTNIHIGIGYRDWCYYHPYAPRCRWDFLYPPHFYDPYYPGYPRPSYDSVSCREARSVLREAGFRRLVTVSCGGRYHRFQAVRGHHNYVIKVSSRTGRIVVVSRS